MEIYQIEYTEHTNKATSLNAKEGYLILRHIIENEKRHIWMWLKDDKKKTLRKGTIDRSLRETIALVASDGTEDQINTGRIDSDTTVHEKENQDQSNKSKRRKVADGPLTLKVEPGLLAVMKPHQREAVTFILDRLTPASAGAILADDVGTGKTLVGLVVLHTLTRSLNCKALIVCPASLVINWSKETKKWFKDGAFSRSLLAITSKAGADKSVYDFVHSSAESRPLLVISYDMFRSFAEALNTLTCLNCILCDEGHRLKNAYGTKTTLSLGACVATRRLVLTGTPVQNNLEELYSVVQFASPYYLGSLSEFKTIYANPMGALESDKGSTSDLAKQEASEAREKLRAKLSGIMLRRTKEEVLVHSLPARTETLLYCTLTDLERRTYTDVVDFEMTDKSTAGQNRVVLSAGNPSAYNADEQIPLHCTSSVLPMLMHLRQLCSAGVLAEKVEDLASSSCKLHVLDALLTVIRSTCPMERVVIVSGFTSSLDSVAALLKKRRWSHLRIDGGVSLERRDRILTAFNSEKANFFVMLLSAKAGGVGLTLTGASRMVLLEPDWNPATDAQCLGRVWRQGQTRPVFIYRLVAAGSVEEVILSRQALKNKLAGAISAGVTEEETHIDTAEIDLKLKSRKDIEDLVFPHGREFCVESRLSSSVPCCTSDAALNRVFDMLKDASMLKIS